MNNSLTVKNPLDKARVDLDEAAHALSNYLETKSDAESVAYDRLSHRGDRTRGLFGVVGCGTARGSASV